MATKESYESEEKLCFDEDWGKNRDRFDHYKETARQAKFICSGCGRVADKDDKLCSPERL